MARIPDEILKRTPQVGKFYVVKDRIAIQSTDAHSIATSFDDSEMSEVSVITTDDPDRVDDVVISTGGDWSGYAKSPVVPVNHQDSLDGIPVAFAWDLGLPVEQRVCTIKVEQGRTTAKLYYSRAIPEGTMFYHLVREGLRGKSIGFSPKSEPRRRPSGGFQYDAWEGMEFSIVTVGCNVNATTGSKGFAEKLRSMLDRGVIGGERVSAVVRKCLTPFAAKRHGAFMAWDAPKKVSKRSFGKFRPIETKRWNASLSSDFDVAIEPSRPANVVYDWVSRHVGVEVKHLFQNGTFVPSARMGSFLTGLKQLLAEHERVDVRNVQYDGREVPPVYKTIQLNSTQRDDFLISGLAFYRGRVKFAVSFDPDWAGEGVTVWTSHADKDFNTKLLDDAWLWSKEHNFLKGEAFSLSGDFIPKTAETWNDVFLEEKNRDTIQRTMDLFNSKGKSFRNRGIILAGPPGTGKTLSSRIVRNLAKGTFIWLSSRDFHMAGSVGGIGFAFEMAKELTPAVLVIEDADNWLSDRTVDFLKTEMDGVARSSGILTILNTNFPERIPEALIDRPGRFDDVLFFAQPTEDVRRKMLAKWLPDVPQSEREQVARTTDGLSGAHVYELASYAKALQEHDGLSASAALKQAVAKVQEQRDLITAIQLEGSNYKPRRGVQERNAKKTLAKRFHIPHNGRKSLTESSGTTGGFTVATETAEKTTTDDGITEEAPKIKEAVAGVMTEHLGEEEGDMAKGHVIHHRAESGELHYSHPDGHDPEMLNKIKAALEGVAGVTGVTLEPNKPTPPDDSWEHVFGKHYEEAGDVVDDPAESAGMAKAVAFVKGMPAWYFKTFLKQAKANALQECVSNKVPKLVAEGYDQDQALAIAYSYCGEKKAITQDGGTSDTTVPGGMNPDEDSADEPHGVTHAKTTIEHHEKELPRMHPNDAKFYKEIVGLVREHAKGEYPDHADKFGEEEKAEEPKEDEDEDEEEGMEATNAALADYKSYRPIALRRLYKRLKRAHHAVVKEATEHMGELAQLPVGEKWKSTHKTATGSHHKAMCSMMKEMEAGNDEEPVEASAKTDVKKNGTVHDAVLQRVEDSAANIASEAAKRILYPITGKKEHKPSNGFTAAK